MKQFVLVFLLVANLFSFQSFALDGEKTNLKVLSWNIFMLPRFVKNTGKINRAELIGKELSKQDYDVIVFQEAFHGGARKKIKAELEKKYQYVAGPANQKQFSFKANSGIWIFSKYPITLTKSIIFKNCYGVDGLARKGALLVELNVNGRKIQVIGTHLQNCGNVKIKYAQCEQLYSDLIKPFAKIGIPQIICGDFNINKGSESYHHMLKTIQAQDGELSGEQKFSYDRLTNDLNDRVNNSRDLIDYILIKENSGLAECNQRSIPLYKYNWHKDHCDLSDHYPIEANIYFNNNFNGLSKIYQSE